MEVVNTYTPEEVEFVVSTDNAEIPKSLGKFKTPKDVQKFLSDENFVVVNAKLSATRLMDDIEKDDLRGMYIVELEDEIPSLEKEVEEAEITFERAKAALKNKRDLLSASEIKVAAWAKEVNLGITDIELDQSLTFEMAHKNQYLYYTYIQGELKLCKVRPILEFDQTSLLNSSEANNDAISKINKSKEVQKTS